MAEGKKSFVLYADLLKSIEHLTNEEKGILFTHLLEYVNDKNPILEDRLILTAWKPIELQLKRDLDKWGDTVEKRSDAGMKSAGKKSFEKWLKEAKEKGIELLNSSEHLFEAGKCYKYMTESYGNYMYYHYEYAMEWHKQMATNSTSVESVEEGSTLSTVNDNDTVNVNVTVNDINNNNTSSPFSFYNSLIKFGFDKNLVSDWLKVRKTKKATNTETSFNNFINELSKRECNLNEILEFIIIKNWSGFKWSWYDTEIEKEKSSAKKENNNERQFTTTTKQQYRFNREDAIKTITGSTE